MSEHEFSTDSGKSWREVSENTYVEFYMPGSIIFRIKPRTIKVNGFDVPEPMREKPKEGDVIYVVTLYSQTGEQASSMPHSGSRWCNSGNQNFWLNHGLVHATKEAAIAHAKAMLGIDPNGGEE